MNAYRSPRCAETSAPALHHASSWSPKVIVLPLRCRCRLWEKTRTGPWAAIARRLAAISASRTADSRDTRAGEVSAIQWW